MREALSCNECAFPVEAHFCKGELMEEAYLIGFIAALFLGLIPAFIAQNKGYSFWGYYIFGVLLFIVALIVILIKPNLNEQGSYEPADSDIKYHVHVRHKEVGEAYREAWTCPECGKGWYIKGSPKIAKCGNADCGCRVYLERQ